MIEIKNLKKKYGDFELDVSMSIQDGAVTGIVGRNGAGKSTTIKAILGLIKPDSGEVLVMGKDSRKLNANERAEIGTALANSGFNTFLTAKDIGTILQNSYKEFDKETFYKNCEKYDLPLQKTIKQYSTGMNARLKVLVALSHKAKLLILDEPTAGLDVVARNQVLDMIREYLSEDSQRSLLISSHISSDLEGLCDDIYMIKDGKIIVHEDTDVLLDNYALLKVTETQYEKLDKQYLIKTHKENFGYSCFTNQRQFYSENYPEVVIEKTNIDDLIIMMSENPQEA